jgi:glutamate-1-semialdehyde 2,1-aminomutase
MTAAQESFISSTYWTERIGPVAAVATIQEMLARNVPKHLCQIGNKLREGLKQAAKHYSIPLKIHGIPPLTIFSFDCGASSQAIHTLFTQEMLKRGFLASKAFYATYAHQDEHLNAYFERVDEVFSLIAKAYSEGTVMELLQGPIAHTGFKRLA